MTPLNWLEAPFVHIGQSLLETDTGLAGIELTGYALHSGMWSVVTALACHSILSTQAGTFSTSISTITESFTPQSSLER
jgi:hypothetical protein